MTAQAAATEAPARITPQARSTPQPRSTTARTLRRLRAGLLAAALAALGASLLEFQGVRATTEAVGSGTAPAIIEVVAARAALVEADAAAIRSFRSGEVRLAGPGVQYQNQLAIASQSLARAAEQNVAGEPASQRIQLIQALLVAYMGLVGQADAHFRQSDQASLGLAYLWHASRLLHMPDGGILDHLDQLREENERVLNRQVATGWTHPGAALLWLAPALVLLGLLAATMSYLYRRFRRLLNLPLVAAAGLVIVVVATAGFSLLAERRLADVQDGLAQLHSDSLVRSEAIGAQARDALGELVSDDCDADSDGCDGLPDHLLAGVTGDPAAGSHTAEPAGDEALTAGIQLVDEHTTAAASAAHVVLLAPAAALLIAVLSVAGLARRIDEYRYRP